MTKPLVIYHAGCMDGFCCAWLFHLAFPDAEFVPAYHGQPPPDVTGRTVYVADFSYPRDVMLDIHCRCLGRLTVLDHHKTAQEALTDFHIEAHSLTGVMPEVRFDMGKSGGRLTWEYLHDRKLLPPRFKNYTRENPTWLVEYTEDRDLWRWKLPGSRAINACLRSYPFDFAEWTRLQENPLGMLEREGEAILRAERQMVERHVKNAKEITVLGHKVLCVNATVLESEIGHELCKDRPFAITYFDREDGLRIYSLRSSDDGLDVGTIAKRFGGGGHRNAAGFQISLEFDQQEAILARG